MNYNMPGGFPGMIPEEPEHENTSINGMMAPSSTSFNFTPSRGLRQPLYPSLDHMASDKYSLQKECNELGYSKKLSDNVLNELDKRAASKVRKTHIGNKSVLSPRSSRFNSTHRSKFGKMESISTHYATIRAKTSTSSLRREEVEMEKENVPSYDPNTKRSGLSILGSASKRRRTATGRQEIVNGMPGSTKVDTLQSSSLRVPAVQPTVKDSRIPQSPSKANLQEPTQSSRTLSHSASSLSLRKTAIPHTRTVSQNISKLTTARQLPRSSTLQNLTKPTASSIQRSASNRNLGQTLRSQPSLSSVSSVSHSLPRAKSTMNMKNPGSKPVWR